jgi:hypothetical protein
MPLTQSLESLEFDSTGEYFQLDISSSFGGGGGYGLMGDAIRVSGFYQEGARLPPRFLSQEPIGSSNQWGSLIGGVLWLPVGHYKVEIATVPRMFVANDGRTDPGPSKMQNTEVNIKGVLKRLT